MRFPVLPIVPFFGFFTTPYLLFTICLILGNGAIAQTVRVAEDGTIYSSYQEAVKSNNPVWYLGLDDAAGSNIAVNQSSQGAGYNGTVTGVVFEQPGIVGTAAQFDSSSITITDSTFNSYRSGYSLEAWVKVSDLTTNQGILRVRDSEKSATYTSSLYYNDVANRSGIQHYAYINKGFRYSTADSKSVCEGGEWVYAVGTYQSGAFNIYINGELKGTYNVTGNNAEIPHSQWELGVGSQIINNGNKFGYNDFIGIMDEVAVYNSVLSSDEIAKHYKIALAKETPRTPAMNFAYNKTASSSSEQTGFDASKVLDGIVNSSESCWLANPGVANAAVVIDLGGTFDINSVSLQNSYLQGSGDISGTDAFKLEYSSNERAQLFW